MFVFVYGTLKKGYNNHHILAKHKFVGEGFTLEKFSMIDSGFPVIVQRKGEELYSVAGEVYDIGTDEGTLKRLDTLEGEGRMYDRKRATVFLPKSRKRISCFVYVGCDKAWGHRENDNDLFLQNNNLVWPASEEQVA